MEALFKSVRKPTHKSSNYAYWSCGYRGHGDAVAEKLVNKLKPFALKSLETKYTDGKVSVHIYY